ncbi:MAG: hypothetical protein R3Y59_02550 [bacterium]
MKKSIFILASAIFMLASCSSNSEQNQNHLEEFGFNGKVESVKYATYKAGEIKGELTKGKLIKGEVRSSDEILTILPIFKAHDYSSNSYGLLESYNEDGFLVEQNEYDSRGRGTQKIVNNYDNENNLTECAFYSKDKLFMKQAYKYDSKGRVSECGLYGDNEELAMTYAYKYDKNNNITQFGYSSPADIPGMNYICKYDNKNNLTECAFYLDDEFYINILYNYDNNNNIIGCEMYNSDNDLEGKIERIYDDKNNITECNEYDNNDKIVTNYTLKYDDYNNLIEYISQGDENSNITYTYEYDDKNNWIKKVTYEKNRPVSIEEREITYY